MRLKHFFVAALLALSAGIAAQAQTAPEGVAVAAGPTDASPPTQIDDLRRLLADPGVQAWLNTAPLPQQAPDTEPKTGPDQGGLEKAIQRMTRYRETILAALPEIPSALRGAWHTLAAEAADYGALLVMVLIGLLVGTGLLAEWRFLRASRGLRKFVLGASEDTIPNRLRKLALRLVLATGAIAVFALASLGMMILIDLPPLVRDVVARALVAAILFRCLLYGARIVLAPGMPSLRVLPLPEDLAVFWASRIPFLGAVMLVGWVVSSALPGLGVPPATALAVATLFALAVLAACLGIFWHRYRLRIDGALFAWPNLVVWALWVTGLFALWASGGMHLFWLVLVCGLLAPTIGIVNRAVNHLLHRAPTPDDPTLQAPPSVLAAVIERGARSGLIMMAVVVLLWAWGIGLGDLLESGDRRAVVVRVLISVALIAAIFDFIWHVTRTAIDTYIDDAAVVSDDPAEARRRARLRTLLPILRNVLRIILGTTSGLMVLATMGVDIAPLIAGAGIVGVAIGFGTQALVRDVVSGMFFVLDDAFRVGEYIIVGSHKGTVESFSLRSIKLRHHRGALYTIPFGSLGAVRNMSRDWVIEKLAFTVPFGTDLAKIKKIMKGVNAALQADPEIAPHMLEPLKSQGADLIADTGLLVKVKFMAVPGEQFIVRRRANALIQTAFAENGVEFAVPTVKVMGRDDTADQMAAVAASHTVAPPPVASPAPE